MTLLLAILLATAPGPWHTEPVAPWYGGRHEYGQRLSCGGHLTPWTVGVAHRGLRCGTRVEMRWHGHRLVTRVIDRGPYPRLVGLPNRLMHLDLTARAMKRLTGRFSTIHHLRWRVVPRYGKEWR